MIRLLRVLLLAATAAAAGPALADHVVVSGGPALRNWELLRVEEDRHDRWWANFIRAATIRIDHLRKDPEAGQDIVWMVYRPGYRDRGREDSKPYLTWIPKLSSKRGIRLVWFSSGEQFIRKLNALPAGSVRTLDYFGHSNRYAFMFEYGSDIIAASTAWLHQDDLNGIDPGIFSAGAVCTSWGCHTGESMSAAWKEALGVPLKGVLGPTNYTVVGKGQLPLANGPWSE